MYGCRRRYDALASLVANSEEGTHSSAAQPLLRRMLQVQWAPVDSVAQGQHHMSPQAQQSVRVQRYHRNGRPRGDRIRSCKSVRYTMHTHVWLGNVQRSSFKERPKVVPRIQTFSGGNRGGDRTREVRELGWEDWEERFCVHLSTIGASPRESVVWDLPSMKRTPSFSSRAAS